MHDLPSQRRHTEANGATAGFNCALAVSVTRTAAVVFPSCAPMRTAVCSSCCCC